MPHPISQPDRFELRNTLVVAAWFGLLAGLIEGAALVAIQEVGRGTWEVVRWPVQLRIIWIAALFGFVLYVAVAVMAGLVGRVVPRLRSLSTIVFLCSFLAVFEWVGLTERVRLYGVFFFSIGVATVVRRWYLRHEDAALRFWRGSLPWLAAVALLAFVGIEAGYWWKETKALQQLAAAKPGVPNVLVIVVDALRADHLSCYGYERATSPNIDQLARQGVLFERAMSTSSWTQPAHVSLLTGRYPFEYGPKLNHLDEKYPTLAEVLQARGYRTGGFSGNSLVFTGEKFGRGFIHFEDIFQSAADMAIRTYFGQKFEQGVLKYLMDDHPGRRRASDITQSTLRWIDQDRERPFFAFLNYFDTHAPFLPPQPFLSRFATGKNTGQNLRRSRLSYDPRLTPQQAAEEVDAYDGAVAYADHGIGELLTGLRERGLADNTLIVITSDHGEALGEHDMFLHRNSLYREVIHVPLIVWWKGRVPAAARVEQPVTNAAVPATVMDLLNEANPPVFPGPSLVALWNSPGDHPDWPYPLSEIEQLPFPELERLPVYSGWIKSLVSPQSHYILHQKTGEELYDWANDPKEVNNLALTPEGQQATRVFSSRLKSLLTAPRELAGVPRTAAK
jgi:arylsulfatase A-like enzyme